MGNKLVITIPRSGNSVRFISDDALSGLLNKGEVKRHVRVSDVEPCPENPAKWEARLQRVGGPTLGPFDSRKEALDAEKLWLIERNLPLPEDDSIGMDGHLAEGRQAAKAEVQVVLPPACSHASH